MKRGCWRRTAEPLLYALQTASANLARTTFEPELTTRVVIDRDVVSRRPLGATAWSIVKDRQYDDQNEDKGDTERESLARILLDRIGLQNKKAKLRYEDKDEEDDHEEAYDLGEDNYLGSENAT